MEPKRKPHGFSVTDEVFNQIRLTAAAKSVTMGELVETAFLFWKGGKTGAAFDSVVAPNREAHELLEYILSEGTSDDREWITGNLRNFSEAIRSRGRKRPSGKLIS